MALYNEILAARFNRALTKMLSMKGPAPAPQLASEIIPVHMFQSGVENRFLESWNLFSIGSQQPAVAAQFGTFQISNPVASGVIAVFHQIMIFEGGADAVNLSRLFTVVANLATVLGSPAPIDSRSVGNSALTISRTTLAAQGDLAGGLIPGVVNAANVPYQYIQTDLQELPMLPGTTWRLGAQTANQVITMGLVWRERPLEESEKGL